MSSRKLWMIDLSLTAGNTLIQERFAYPSNYPILQAEPKKLEEWTKRLISVRKLIKGDRFMGKSGTHDSDIFNYIVKAAGSDGSLTMFGVFPFLLLSSQGQRLQ
jgi:hypothetical protein